MGTVREFYPKSPQEMEQLHLQFYQSHPELRAQSSGAAPTGRRVAGAAQGSDDQEFRREFIRFLWGNSLTAAEQEQLRTADFYALNRMGLDVRRRARLDVLESFLHADSPDFELYTNLGGPACGFDFQVGQTYLVRASRSAPDQPWRVSSCVAPKPADAAGDELEGLRGWKAGITPKRRIFGDVFSRDRQGFGRITLSLLGGPAPLVRTTEGGSAFEFSDLDPGKYQLVWGAAASESRSIDLTRAWCARVDVPVGGR